MTDKRSVTYKGENRLEDFATLGLQWDPIPNDFQMNERVRQIKPAVGAAEHKLAKLQADLAEARRKLERETERHLRTEQALLESNSRMALAESAARARAEQITAHSQALLALAQLDEADFDAALKTILKAAAETLAVERVSYWRLSGSPLESQREMLYLKSRGDSAPDATTLSFDAAHYPRYFAALASHQPIVANLAEQDPASSEFAETFLKPHGITSMLDVAVWSQGEIAGVLCHSHVGPPRVWSVEEVKFATSIAHAISLALEADHRRELAAAFRQSEEKYRLVVQHAGEGIFVLQDRRVCFVNPRGAELWGVKPEQMLGLPMVDLIHPDDYPRVSSNYEKRLRGEPVENNYLLRTLPTHRESRWLQIAAVAVDWDGRRASLSFVTDVTERVLLNEQLQHSLVEREAILESSTVGLVFIRRGRINWINGVLERQMLGYAKGELIGQHSEVTYPSHEHWRTFLSAAVPAIETGRTHEVELQLKRRDGSLFWGIFSGRAIDPKDLNKGSIWSFTDITERRKLELDLQKTLTEREAILETTVVGIVSVQFGIVRWINTILETQLLGYTKGELVGQRAELFFTSHEQWKRCLQEGVPLLEGGNRYRTEFQARRKDGSLFWCEFVGRALDSSNLDAGSIWALTDISERVKLQQDLQKTLTEREAILQSTLVGITFVIGRRHIWINQKLADMLGYPPEELIGQSAVIHYPSREAFEALGAVAYPTLARGVPYAAEAQMKRKDGSLIWCQLYGSNIVPGRPDRGTIWTFVDITELKRALDKEKELGELKSRFVSMTSHEFRTPLATILSATELLENYGERLPANEKIDLVALVKRSVKHMTHMLDQVLLIGKAEAGKMQFNPAPLDLKGFCRKLIGELGQSDGHEHGLAFTHDGLRERHRVDEKLLRHILNNLLSNAMKYSPAGSQVDLRVGFAGGRAKIEVSDRGIGIAPEDREHLFHSFHRGRNVSNISGTGLGLAIVKKAVELHDGSIGFDSQLGRGTTFVVDLPAPEV